VPIVVSTPLSTSNTLSKMILSPVLNSPDSLSTFIVSPTAILYCLPPVNITANSLLSDISLFDFKVVILGI